jgi:hypothetical protein
MARNDRIIAISRVAHAALLLIAGQVIAESVQTDAVSANGGACNSTGGSTYLESAALGVASGQYCVLSMGGLTSELVTPAGTGNCPNESHLEYAHAGAYDPVNRRIGVASGPHTGTVTGECGQENYVFLLYDEATNMWSLEDQSKTGFSSSGHGYDLTAVDPTTGDFYVSAYNTESLWRRNANGSWQSLTGPTSMSCTSATCASGATWDTNRRGYIRFGDGQEDGVWLYSKASGSWSKLTDDSAFGGFNTGYHYTADFHPSTGLVWLQDGNGSSKHWKLNPNNTVTALHAAPMNLGCCGSGGALSAYDGRTQKFVVVNPFSNAMYEFDIVNDAWSSVGAPVPLNNADSSDVEGFVVSLPRYEVIMYVMARGGGGHGTPQAFLYKTGSSAVKIVTPMAPTEFRAQ